MADGKTGIEKSMAKIELSELISISMPKGEPDWRALKYNMPVATLVAENGRKEITMVLICLLKDFCDSLNVVRNMTEDQIIDAATMLRDECGDFRMEDYAMMLTMAKRNRLGVKILDRVDIQTIGMIKEAYEAIRRQGIAESLEQEAREYEKNLKNNLIGWIVATRLTFFNGWSILVNAYEYWRVKPLRDLRMKLANQLHLERENTESERIKRIEESKEKIEKYYNEVLAAREKQKQKQKQKQQNNA
jgi:hypothetical protein